jgi:hypothetical protein
MDGVKKLLGLFKACPVLTLKDMTHKLARSRTSVLRYLNETGYHSSYNSAGEYYTLPDIPSFDGNGLWKHGQAYFAVHGSLRDTATALIKDSTCGYTHEGLRDILGVRMYNTLLDLVNDGAILRRDIGGKFVYFGHGHGEEQIGQRRAAQARANGAKAVTKMSTLAIPAVGLNEIIEVLVAFIGGHCELMSAYHHLRRKGVKVTPKQVRSIFEFYGLGKKNCF